MNDERSPHRRRHAGALVVLLALALGLAGLGVSAARLRGALDLPLDTALQIFSIDAMGDAAGLADLFSRNAEADRLAELQRQREAEAAAMVGGAAAPVAYIVVRGAGQQPMPGSQGAAAPDHDPPTAPRAVAASPGSSTTMEVAWEESQDDDRVLGYEIVREGTSPFTSETTHFTDSGLKPATRYCYRIIAIDGAGNRSREAGPACAMTPGVLPPTMPGRIVAHVVPPSSVALSWSGSVSESGYVSYEILDGTQVIATTTETTWTHANADRRQHRYAVRAVDATGNRSGDTQATLVSLRDLEPPTQPGAPKVTALSPKQLKVEWAASTDNEGEVRYEVLEGGNVVGRSDTSNVVVLADEDSHHCYTVRAIDREGNASGASASGCGRTMDQSEWNASRKASSGRQNPAAYYAR